MKDCFNNEGASNRPHQYEQEPDAQPFTAILNIIKKFGNLMNAHAQNRIT